MIARLWVQYLLAAGRPAGIFVRATLTALLFAGCWVQAACATTYDVPPETAPGSIGSGDVLNLSDGGVLPASFVVNSGGVMNVYGGTMETSEAYFYGEAGSEINFYGGDLEAIEYGTAGVFNLFGGQPGDFPFYDGVFNLYGGDAGKNGYISNTVNLHGGNFQDNFLGPEQGTLNIFGRQFVLDGQVLTGLEPGVATAIEERDVVLEGVLEDGSPFSFSLDLQRESFLGPGFVRPGFTVTATLIVPEPASGCLFVLATLGSLALARRSVSWRCGHLGA